MLMDNKNSNDAEDSQNLDQKKNTAIIQQIMAQETSSQDNEEIRSTIVSEKNSEVDLSKNQIEDVDADRSKLTDTTEIKEVPNSITTEIKKPTK